MNYTSAILIDKLFSTNTNSIDNALIIFNDDRIVYLGEKNDEILKKYSPDKVLNLKGTIMPGFVNTHTHLELSHLESKLEKKSEGLTEWFSQLVNVTNNFELSDGVEYAIQNSITKLQEVGTVAVGDISNTEKSCNPLISSNLLGTIFLEYFNRFGLDKVSLPSTINNKPENLIKISLSPHGLYSASQDLVSLILNKNKQANRKTSIHWMENIEEVEFYNSPDSKLKKYFETSWKENFPSMDHPYSFIEKFKQKYVDSSMILVHNTHISNKDILYFKQQETSLVLCPKSNLFIGNQLPPIEELFKYNLNLSLGTDSLASNDSLDVREEASFIYNNFKISEDKLLFALTYGGAKALGIENDYGLIIGAHKNSLVHSTERITSNKEFIQNINSLNLVPLSKYDI